MREVLAKRDTAVIGLLVWCAWKQHMNFIICLLGTGCWIYRGWTSVTAKKTQNMCLSCKMWLNSEKWRGKRNNMLNRTALLFKEVEVENGVGDIYKRRHQYIRIYSFQNSPMEWMKNETGKWTVNRMNLHETEQNEEVRLSLSYAFRIKKKSFEKVIYLMKYICWVFNGCAAGRRHCLSKHK